MRTALVPSSNGSYPNTAYIASTTATGSSTSGIAALDIVNISTPSSMQGVEQVVDAAAIFSGFGYDLNLLLATGNTTSLRNRTFHLYRQPDAFHHEHRQSRCAGWDQGYGTEIATTGTYVVQPLERLPPGTDIFAIVNNPPSTDPAGPSSLMIVDASTPSAPVLYPFITQFGTTDVTAVNGYLLVPNVNGLAIYTIQTP